MLVEETLQLEEICTLTHEERRRSLGAFYTPSFLSKLLCLWAIECKNQVVLEPSFGGCTFLEEIASRFSHLGSSTPLQNVFGCDIDSNAFLKLDTLNIGEFKENFIKKDFLLLDDENFCSGKADIVIGNPPYIGHSQIGSSQRKSVEKWKTTYGLTIDARSSLWVYFLIHSLNFLKDGGRLAFVLPGSFLSADYSKKIHSLLREKFEHCLIAPIAERIFISEGAEERTVILLADGFKHSSQSPGTVKIAHTATLSKLPELFIKWMKNKSELHDFESVGAGSFLERNSQQKFAEISKNTANIELESIARVNIGIVTGDTKFFIKQLSAWQNLGINREHYEFIVPKIRDINGLNLTNNQVQTLIDSDARCLILNTKTKFLSAQVLSYLSSYPAEKLDLATYKKRPVWHQPNDHKVPDAFLTFLTHNGPRLLINSAKANCTNSVYRMFLKERTSANRKKFIALSFLSTFTQTHAEIIGRPCGSGALKLEPKDALKLRILYPKVINSNLVDVSFKAAHKELSKNPPNEEAARKIADDALASMLGEDFRRQLMELEGALHSAREHRKGNVA
ncbi:HsdM family class I SAM-dependent methyltransferase [Pseudomonas aeruginosa]|uniref:HsdM family class I SAM-dependent methyltransferase n=1 Tax=Pseudomonas aeruginosa TaxID=287 RepID=UPI000B010515|nr:N-6 DNA methylase [Pseudomonas aeruginosa]EKY1193940.1 N-6 DNA methylase [Pseudomonas aeruginosa]MBI8359458.1 N-6 DNA methylase [Pseudomonas aeruginosa]MBI9133202.1 N-6 DNA methylase [Pseudomonas aeruginosa]MCV4374291.1 SAM-dependent methyltransferase [Pseudomonas aeruginosa]MDI9788576.1 N-6 DNA methylase [Pseudomonas aeruginosa]